MIDARGGERTVTDAATPFPHTEKRPERTTMLPILVTRSLERTSGVNSSNDANRRSSFKATLRIKT